MVARPVLRLVKSVRDKRQVQPTELELTVREWLISLKQLRRSPATIEKYMFHLDLFLRWMQDESVTRPVEISRVLLRQWGADIQEYSKWSSATARLAVAVVRSFLGWCVEESMIDREIVRVLRLPPVKQRIHRTCFPDEVRALLGSCDDSVRGKRDAALVSLMVDTGLRASEVCGVKISDVHLKVKFGEGTVNYLSVVIKGGREGYGVFDEPTVKRLETWLEVRQARPGVDELFVSLGGTRPLTALTRSGIGDILENLSSYAGIEHVTPHSLRRGFAVMMGELGHPTRTTQLLGRWSDIRMVQVYDGARDAMRAGLQFNGRGPSSLVDRQ